ncbi:MAG TPA: formate/nitrite transporter family protein [Tepidisphaeraceae bacterium]|jgi:formate/nitrite transporter FocA (FNT family)|nr:formate/nitrite transporter family protein [Tepidisphaeraceae bacterium]
MPESPPKDGGDSGKGPSPPGPPPEPRDDEEQDHERAVGMTAASAYVVYRAVLKESLEELDRPSIALAWSGLAAGLCMGFSLVTDGLLESRLPDTAWRDLIEKLGYTIGFVILILSRQQLFTENTLTPIIALLKYRDGKTLYNVCRLWAILLFTNLLGGVAIAYTLQRSPAFSPEEREAFLRISSEAMQPDRMALFVKGIFAGWLIATMVWMLPFAETGRIWVVILVPYVIGLGRLSHIIIGSIYCFYTIAAHQQTWWEYFRHFAGPVLLGNCIGGVALVAVVNYAQATAGSEERGARARHRAD